MSLRPNALPNMASRLRSASVSLTRVSETFIP
jgi:hypothetical protein